MEYMFKSLPDTKITAMAEFSADTVTINKLINILYLEKVGRLAGDILPRGLLSSYKYEHI